MVDEQIVVLLCGFRDASEGEEVLPEDGDGETTPLPDHGRDPAPLVEQRVVSVEKYDKAPHEFHISVVAYPKKTPCTGIVVEEEKAHLNPNGWMFSCRAWLKHPPMTNSSFLRTAEPKLQHSTCGTVARWRHLESDWDRRYVI